MSVRSEILARLHALSIPHELHEHAPAHTMADCLALPYSAPDVTFCKNLLLCNTARTAFYLYITLADKPFRTSEVSRALHSSRLSFAPPDALPALLGVESGSLSPLALWFDTDEHITLAIDREVHRPGRIAFHPGDNTATVIFDQQVFWAQVIPALAHPPREV